MFSRNNIQSLSNAKSVQRGRTIARQPGNIIGRNLTHLNDEIEISADVRSVSGISEYFHTTIVVDKDNTRIVDYACNCPASVRYDSMCKHCVAVALDFMEEPSSYGDLKRDTTQKTSRSLLAHMELLRQANAQTVEEGSVSLEPELTCDFGNWTMRLRIASGDVEYVVLDIGEFAESVRTAAFKSYGKRLGFTHTLNAFDEASKRLAEVIVRLAPAHDKAAKLQLPKRFLNLESSDVADILDALGSKPLRYTDTAHGVEAYNEVVIDGDPAFALTISEAEDGFEIERRSDIVAISNERHLYLCIKNTIYRCTEKLTRLASFFTDVYLSDEDQLFIAKKDVPLFCATTLKELEDALDVSAPQIFQELKPVKGDISYYFDLIRVNKKEIITVEVRVAYGNHEFIVSDPSHAGMYESTEHTEEENEADPHDGFVPLRDLDMEARATSALAHFFEGGYALPLENEEQVGNLLY